MRKKAHFKSLIIGAFFLLVFSIGNSANAYVISGGKSGGDCSLIGSWDVLTQTCTLSTDIYATYDNTEAPYYNRSSNSRKTLLYVDSSGITLDGNGHSLIGPDNGAISIMGVIGIYLEGKNNVTISNFTIKNFIAGIWLNNRASRNVISNNNLSDNEYGVHAFGASSNNVITGNILSNNSKGIDIWKDCSRNFIIGNTDSSNGIGIYLFGAGNNNTITNNSLQKIWFEYFSENTTVYGNTISGELRFDNSSNNIIYNNNILGAIYSSSSMNKFNLDAPTGGNYWGAACNDSNIDGFCDEPHNIPSANDFDYLPWATENGWLKGR